MNVPTLNGSAVRIWRIVVATTIFCAPMLAYYVHAEGQASISEFREEVEDEYVSHQDFNTWRRWEYKKDIAHILEQQKQTLEVIKQMRADLEKHRTDTE